AKPAERSRDVYRFEVAAEPNKPVTLDVMEELPRVQEVALNNTDDESVRVFIRAGVVSDKGKNALQEALAMKPKVSDDNRDMPKHGGAMKENLAGPGPHARQPERSPAHPRRLQALRQEVRGAGNRDRKAAKRIGPPARSRGEGEERIRGVPGRIEC